MVSKYTPDRSQAKVTAHMVGTQECQCTGTMFIAGLHRETRSGECSCSQRLAPHFIGHPPPVQFSWGFADSSPACFMQRWQGRFVSPQRSTVPALLDDQMPGN